MKPVAALLVTLAGLVAGADAYQDAVDRSAQTVATVEATDLLHAGQLYGLLYETPGEALSAALADVTDPATLATVRWDGVTLTVTTDGGGCAAGVPVPIGDPVVVTDCRTV